MSALAGDPGLPGERGLSWRRTSIISKITLLVLVVGLPLGGIIAWSLYAQFQSQQVLGGQQAVVHAAAVAAHAEEVVREARSLLQSLARRPGVQAMNPLDCDPFLADVLATLPRYVNINTFNLRWEYVCSGRRISQGHGVASTLPSLYERMKSLDDMALSAPVEGQMTGKRAVVTAFPVKNAAGQLVGAVTAPIDLAELSRGLGALRSNPGSIVELVAASGALIAAYPVGQRIGAVPETLATDWGGNGPITAIGRDGIERTYAQARVAGTDWTATVARPNAGELSQLRRYRQNVLAASLLVFILAGWLALVLGRRITRPLRELERDARMMAAGGLHHRSQVAGTDEVGQVAAGLNDLCQAVQDHAGMHQRAAVEASEREQRLGGIVASALDAIVTIDAEGRITESNPAARRMFDYDPAELEGQPVESILIDRFHAGRSALGSAYGSGRSVASTMALRVVRGMRKDGSELALEASISHHEAGGVRYTTAFLRDITQRLKADEQIRRLNRVHAMLAGISALIIRAQGRDELFREACRIAVDDGAYRMAWVGVIDPQTLDGNVVAICGAPDGYTTGVRLTARAGQPESSRPACRALRVRRPVIANDIATDPGMAEIGDGLLASGMRSAGCFPFFVRGRVEGVLVLFAGEKDAFDEEETRLLDNLAGDISFALDQIDKQARLDFLAYYDPLTGLANRALFLERAGPTLRGAAAASSQLAVLLLDVERFRNVNDSLGRPAGDALLRKMGEWLVRAAGDATLVARLDADRFAVLLPDVRDRGAASECVAGWLEALRAHPFALDEAVFRIDAKVGIALFPTDGTTAELLLRNAEAALKRAKTEGERYLFHTQQMTESAVGKLTFEKELRQAVEDADLAMLYLPRVSLATGMLVGGEALLQCARLGEATELIPALEEMGLMPEVGRWMLRQAVADNRHWIAAGLPRLRIAINVSARQLRHNAFLADIAAAVAGDPEAIAGLEIEVSESAIMQDVKRSVEILGALRATRVTVTIDDFGAGFSSLRYLGRLPADILKIDASFVTDMTKGPQGLALVSTFIRLAHSLKMKVVAQGVATAEQAGLLTLLGCDEAQGPHVGGALTSVSFQARLAAAQHEAPLAARRVRQPPVSHKAAP